MKTLIFLVAFLAASCSPQVEPQPEKLPTDTLIASDSVDTLLLIRTNKKDSTDN